MQRIERYGVLALVFLLVTIVTFALWDDDAKPGDEVAAADSAARRSVPTRERMSSTDRARAARDAANRVDNRRPANRTQPGTRSAEEAGMHQRFIAAQREREARNARNAAKPEGRPQGFVKTDKPTVDGPKQQQNYDLRIGEQGSTPEPKTAGRTPTAKPVAFTPEPSNREKTRKMDEQRRRREHRVQSGETLSVIAEQQLGASSRWHEIAALNPSVDPNRLQVGERLKLPAPGAAASSVASTPQPSSKPAVRGPGGNYTIQRGDVLSKIAERELGSVKRLPEILALNPGLDPRSLAVGQVIAMPDGANTTVARARTSSSNSNARRDDRPRVR